MKSISILSSDIIYFVILFVGFNKNSFSLQSILLLFQITTAAENKSISSFSVSSDGSTGRALAFRASFNCGSPLQEYLLLQIKKNISFMLYAFFTKKKKVRQSAGDFFRGDKFHFLTEFNIGGRSICVFMRCYV